MTDHEARDERRPTASSEQTLRMRRDLSRSSNDGFIMAFELVLTPALFAFIGWRLDDFFGSGPFLLILFFVFVLGYEVWKLTTRYGADMDEEQRKLLGGDRP